MQKFILEPHIRYYFLGGHVPYTGISANLVTLLTNAHFDNYIS